MNLAAATYWSGDDARSALKEFLPTPPRRAGQFAELALLGAVQCAAGIELPRDTAIVLASRSGNRRQAEDLARTIALERTAPMPFAFIASQSGAACQVIAQQLDLEGAALCISSRRAPFEHALALADALLRQDGARAALVGWVEESDGTVSGASHWLLLNRQAPGNSGYVELLFDIAAEDARQLATGDMAVDLGTDAAVALGQPPAPDERAMTRRLLVCRSAGRDYRRICALDNDRYVALTIRR